MDQSARVDLSRRQEHRRQRDELDGRGRRSQRATAPRLDQGVAPSGTEILVEGYQAKDGANRANGRDITFKDGKKLFVGSAGTGAPEERKEP